MHPILTRILASEETTLPFLIDEMGLLELVSYLTRVQVVSIDECKTGMIPGVSLYEKDVDTKHLSVKNIRSWIDDMSETPYEKKYLYILRDFDTATIEGVDSALKVLEEPPKYALIALVVRNPDLLLETIRSRTINLATISPRDPLPEGLRQAIEAYHDGDESGLLGYVFREKIEKDEAITILEALIPHADGSILDRIEEALVTLMRVNESPKNILERVLLAPKTR